MSLSKHERKKLKKEQKIKEKVEQKPKQIPYLKYGLIIVVAILVVFVGYKFLNKPDVQGDTVERVKGNLNAPVTIVEFSDFQCPFCGRFAKETLPLIEQNYIETGKVKLIFKDFPLPSHQFAQKASEAAECAGDQGKYWEYHDILFRNQNDLRKNDLKNYAKQLNLDTSLFNECLDSGKYKKAVQDDLNEGIKLGVKGTPAFFINGKFVSGAQPYSVFKQMIEEKLR